MIACFKCGKDTGLTPGQKIGRKEECPHCTQDFHVCKVCKFFDLNAYNQCREAQAERVAEKDKANFCDYFQLVNPGHSGDNKQDLQDAANALFKD